MLRGFGHVARLTQAAATMRRSGALVVMLERFGVSPWRRRLALIITAPLSPFGRPGDPNLPPVARAFAALSPGFIKLGQALSTRADMVGEETATDLRLLQDSLPPFSLEEAKVVVSAELGAPVAELFSDFGPAIAAASIAQVHPAWLPTGEKVAVKVLRPGVERRFYAELDSFLFASRLMEALIPAVRRMKPVAVCHLLRDNIAAELDLRLEAAAASEFTENVADDPKFRTPRIRWTLTSQRVMTMDWIEGVSVSDHDALNAMGLDLPKLAEHVVQSFLRHALRDGYFHADMHQGNLRVDADGALVALDFGIMGRLEPFTRRVYAEILLGFLRRDYMRAAKAHLDAGYLRSNRPIEEFALALRAIGEPIFGQDSTAFSSAKMLAQMFQVTEQFGMETQTELVLLQKTMVMVEGVARTLDPHFNMWRAGEPVLADWMRTNLGPAGAARDMAQTAERLQRLGPRLPQLAETLLDRLQEPAPPPPPKTPPWMWAALGMVLGAGGVLIAQAVAGGL